MVEKIDFKKTMAQFYLPSAKEFSIVDVPAFNFLMIDGKGNPNTSPVYVEALQALYSLAYTLKFALKKQVEYTVPPLEGLWWAEDMSSFLDGHKERWLWTMMIMQPEAVTQQAFEQARITAMRKKPSPALERVRLEPYHEGLSVQILYFGSYSDEGPTIARMHQFIQDEGYATNGKHHEIYIGDPRKAVPEKLRTVIRQPICTGKTSY
jgi:hypothetical protein